MLNEYKTICLGMWGKPRNLPKHFFPCSELKLCPTSWRRKRKFRRVTRGGRGRGLPCPFLKIEKNVLILEKNAQTVVICGLHFSFTMKFLRVFKRKSQRFILAGSFFLTLYMIIYQSALIPKKLPFPKKFLVTRLKLCWSLFLIKLLAWRLPYHIFIGFFPFFSNLLLLLSGYTVWEKTSPRYLWYK